MRKGGDTRAAASAHGKKVGRPKVEREAKAPNKARATYILEGLKLTDAEWKAQGHPDREPYYAEPQPKDYSTPRDFVQAHLDWEFSKRCECEDCLWRRDCLDRGQGGRSAREYLWNRRDGHAVRVINHVHDKPIDLNVNLSLGERMKVAMEKASERAAKR